MDEKYDMLKIDVYGSVQTMIGAGKLNAEGSFHYLDDSKVGQTQRIYS